jgi:hypothetical protein
MTKLAVVAMADLHLIALSVKYLFCQIMSVGSLVSSRTLNGKSPTILYYWFSLHTSFQAEASSAISLASSYSKVMKQDSGTDHLSRVS